MRQQVDCRSERCKNVRHSVHNAAADGGSMARSTDITSFTEHRQHLRDHIRRVQETGRPLYVTTNGVAAAVVMSPEAYDALADKADLLESLITIERSMEDVRSGQGVSFKDAIRGVAKDLGLSLDP